MNMPITRATFPEAATAVAGDRFLHTLHDVREVFRHFETLVSRRNCLDEDVRAKALCERLHDTNPTLLAHVEGILERLPRRLDTNPEWQADLEANHVELLRGLATYVGIVSDYKSPSADEERLSANATALFRRFANITPYPARVQPAPEVDFSLIS